MRALIVPIAEIPTLKFKKKSELATQLIQTHPEEHFYLVPNLSGPRAHSDHKEHRWGPVGTPTRKNTSRESLRKSHWRVQKRYRKSTLKRRAKAKKDSWWRIQTKHKNSKLPVARYVSAEKFMFKKFQFIGTKRLKSFCIGKETKLDEFIVQRKNLLRHSMI